MYKKDIDSFGIIYKAINKINNKVYIGQTTQTFKGRKWQHKHQSFDKNNNQVFYRALRKYGWNNFKWKVIDTANNIEELNQKEIYWIDYYKSYIGNDECNGYNMTIGGESTVGFYHTKEFKKHLSNINTGTKNSNCKITEDVVIKVKELLRDTNLLYPEIAKTVGISKSSVCNIYYGRNWSSVEVEGFTPNMYRNIEERFSENSKNNAYNMTKKKKQN